jgi:hypothetical protein
MMTMNEYNEADAQIIGDHTAFQAVRRQRLVQDAVADGRKLVTVRRIDAIDDIPGADLIKVASVEGWKVVVKAGEFQVGDSCVFFEVDSFLPLDDERYAFLAKNKITWNGIDGARLKTIRLRKQLSQGLALPLSLFPEVEEFIDGFHRERDAGRHTYDFEDIRQYNFTGLLGIMKWEPPVPSAQLVGLAKGNFPSFLKKSDQERAQNMGNQIFGYEDVTYEFSVENIPDEALDAMCARGDIVWHESTSKWHKVRKAEASRDTRYEVTMKMDGSSMTAYVKNAECDEGLEIKGVCSRNLDLKLEGNEDNAFVKMASPDLLELIAEQGGDVALQGELMGPGIQGNQERFTENRFFVYNIFDIKNGEFMTPDQRLAWIKSANECAKNLFGCEMIEHVPVLHFNVTLAELGIHNMDDLLKFADGPSMVAAVREGLVFKAMDGSHQFKVISNKWLEGEK